MNLSTKILLIIIAVLVVLSSVLYWRNTVNKNNYIIYKNNLEVLQDSIKVIELENGELMTTIGSYILDIDELEKYIDIQKTYVEDVEKQLDASVLYISKIEAELNVKNEQVSEGVIEQDSLSNTYTSTFNFSDEWYNVGGTINIYNNTTSTYLNTLTMQMPLTVGLTEDWRIFVNTDNPYVDISNIQGAMLDPSMYVEEEKRLNISLQAGYYAIYNNGVKAGPGVGIGVGWRIW